jgi:hypothetical protein
MWKARQAYREGHLAGETLQIDWDRHESDPIYARGVEVGNAYYLREFIGSKRDSHGVDFAKPRHLPLPRRSRPQQEPDPSLVEAFIAGRQKGKLIPLLAQSLTNPMLVFETSFALPAYAGD